MDKTNESRWKVILDSILIYNLYLLIIGSFFLAFSFILSIKGNPGLYKLFQKLWYPLFIPSLSLFFTAILIDAIYNKLVEGKRN